MILENKFSFFFRESDKKNYALSRNNKNGHEITEKIILWSPGRVGGRRVVAAPVDGWPR